MFECLLSHGSELVLNSVEHMGTGIIKLQDDAFCHITVTFAVLQLVKHLRVTICINLTFRGLCIVIYSYNKTNEMH